MSSGGRTRSGTSYQPSGARQSTRSTSRTPLCVIQREDGKPCGSRGNFDARGRCMFAHKNYAMPGEPRCRGKTTKGKDCRLEPKPGSAYCSPQHDPTKELEDPAAFRIDDELFDQNRGGLREDREDAIARRDRSMDIYTDAPVMVTDRRGVELDHVLELQIINAVYYSAMMDVDEDLRQWLLGVVKPIVNGDGNLGLTTKALNRDKAKAVKEFLDHEPLLATAHPKPSLRECLAGCIHNSDVVESILRRLQDAYEFVKRNLQVQLEKRELQKMKKSKTLVLKRFIDTLDQMTTAMQLVVETPSATAVEAPTPSRVRVSSTTATATQVTTLTPPNSPRPTSRRQPLISPLEKTKGSTSKAKE